jgi:hypothetical protein
MPSRLPPAVAHTVRRASRTVASSALIALAALALVAAPAPAASVKGAVRQAFLQGAIPAADHDSYRLLYDESRSVRRRLSGARRAELHSVIVTLERIAAAEDLTPPRMPALFLTLERNTEFWRSRPFPAQGARLSLGTSPVIFQYYRGEGLQLQPLANFARANALYNACVGQDTRPGVPCRRGALRDLLDAMVALGVQRGGFTAWEYYFEFGGGRPPWVSGLAQGTAIQALARASALLQEPSYLEVARGALGAFEQGPPVGVRVPADGGNHYLIYSFSPRLRVLNGFLQSVSGLYDFARASADPRAQALFAAGDLAAREAVPRYDTGAWSLYARPGRESDLGYHRLVRDFAGNLCERTAAPVYCDAERRFTRYLYEHPRLELLPARAPRAGRPAAVRFRLSKVSRVSVSVTRGARQVHYARTTLGYGRRAFAFRPARAGRYRFRLEAADLRNHHTVVRGAFSVRRSRPLRSVALDAFSAAASASASACALASRSENSSCGSPAGMRATIWLGWPSHSSTTAKPPSGSPWVRDSQRPARRRRPLRSSHTTATITATRTVGTMISSSRTKRYRPRPTFRPGLDPPPTLTITSEPSGIALIASI